ncbi:hypothetical protein, partial [Consotaella aegiceratis]|uniref:hypothetical protein n=1 Tax=Consotaella aegiceratis TaxID=3097961 RepID=UPI002F415707
MGRERGRVLGGFRLEQRYDAAGQIVAQEAGPRHPAVHDRSRLGVTVPVREEARRAREHARRLYDYDKAFAPVSIDDALWGERRLSYDGNGQLDTSKNRRFGGIEETSLVMAARFGLDRCGFAALGAHPPLELQ